MKHKNDFPHRITVRRWVKTLRAVCVLVLLGITSGETNAFAIFSAGETNRPIISALGTVAWNVGDRFLEETEKHSLRLPLPERPIETVRSLTSPRPETGAETRKSSLEIDPGAIRFTFNLLLQDALDSVPARPHADAVDLKSRSPVVPASLPPSSGVLFVMGLVGMLGTACWRDSPVAHARDLQESRSHRPGSTRIVVVLSADMDFAKKVEEHLHHSGYAVRIAVATSEILADSDPASVALVLVDPRIHDWDMLRTDPALRHVLLMAVIPLGSSYPDDACLSDLERGMDGIHDLRDGHRLLAAKVGAYLRRAGCDKEHRGVYQVGAVELDGDAREVKIAGRPVKFSAKPFAILAALMRRPSNVLSRSELVTLVWGPDFAISEHTLDVHICAIRQQLDREPNRLCELVTIKRVGLKLQPVSSTGRTPREEFVRGQDRDSIRPHNRAELRYLHRHRRRNRAAHPEQRGAAAAR